VSRADEALSAISHELRTPLAAITGFAELLQARDDERVRAEATTRILEAAEQLSAAIERLLQAIAAEEDLAIRLAVPEERK
jgi:signal transduction histidine kinase